MAQSRNETPFRFRSLELARHETVTGWMNDLLYRFAVAGRLAVAVDENQLSRRHTMKTFEGYRLITPGELTWRPSNLMRIPNADYLERTGSELLGARLWRLPPQSANTLHRHIIAEEFFFVLEGTGRMRVGDETLTIPRHGGILVGPSVLRQIFNDTDAEALWLIVGAPDKEFEPGAFDPKQFYPVEPTQLPPELKGVAWPPTG